jgi:lactoylglutathione lyase
MNDILRVQIKPLHSAAHIQTMPIKAPLAARDAMSSPSLNLVVLRFADLEMAARFYAALGFSLVKEKHDAGPEHYACRLDSVVLELYPAGKLGAVPGTAMFGFSVSSMELALRAVESHGGSTISAPLPSERGIRSVVSDPGGHRLELVEPHKTFKADS